MRKIEAERPPVGPPDPDSMGAEIRQFFDFEQEDFPPFFLDTLVHIQGFDQVLARHERRARDELVLRRFFERVGLDYVAHQRRQRRRRRRFVLGICTGVLFLALAAVLCSVPQALEALRMPLFQWWQPAPTPITERSVTRYTQIAAIQPYFSVALPQVLPAGFRLVSVSLEEGFPAGPRAVLFYQRGDPSDPDSPGAEVHLAVWSLQDEPFPFPAEATLEAVDLAGLPAFWIAESGGASGPARWLGGGYLLWERDGWKFALGSGTLSRDELVQIGTQLIRQ